MVALDLSSKRRIGEFWTSPRCPLISASSMLIEDKLDFGILD